MPASQAEGHRRAVTNKRKKVQQEEGSRPETATGASVTGASSGQTFTGYTRAGALAYLGQQLELQDQQLEDSQQLVTELTVKSRVLNRVPEPLRSLCVLADAESSDEMVAGAWARLQVSLIALAGQSDDIGLLDAPAIGQSIEIEREKWDAVLRQWREAPEYLKRIHGGPVDGGGSGPDSGVVSWLARQSADSFQDRYDRQTVELLLRAAIVHRKAKSYIQGGFDDHEAAALLGPCLEISRSGPVQWPSNAIGLAKSPQQQRMIGCASLWLPSLGETGKGAENGVWVAYDIAPALQMVRVYHFISRLPATDEDLAMTVRDRRHVRQVFGKLVAQLGHSNLLEWVLKLEHPCRMENHVVAGDAHPSGPVAVHIFQALLRQDEQVLHCASPGMRLFRNPSSECLPLLRMQQRMGLGNTFICALTIRDKIRQGSLPL